MVLKTKSLSLYLYKKKSKKNYLYKLLIIKKKNKQINRISQKNNNKRIKDLSFFLNLQSYFIKFYKFWLHITPYMWNNINIIRSRIIFKKINYKYDIIKFNYIQLIKYLYFKTIKNNLNYQYLFIHNLNKQSTNWLFNILYIIFHNYNILDNIYDYKLLWNKIIPIYSIVNLKQLNITTPSLLPNFDNFKNNVSVVKNIIYYLIKHNKNIFSFRIIKNYLKSIINFKIKIYQNLNYIKQKKHKNISTKYHKKLLKNIIRSYRYKFHIFFDNLKKKCKNFLLKDRKKLKFINLLKNLILIRKKKSNQLNIKYNNITIKKKKNYYNIQKRYSFKYKQKQSFSNLLKNNKNKNMLFFKKKNIKKSKFFLTSLGRSLINNLWSQNWFKFKNKSFYYELQYYNHLTNMYIYNKYLFIMTKIMSNSISSIDKFWQTYFIDTTYIKQNSRQNYHLTFNKKHYKIISNEKKTSYNLKWWEQGISWINNLLYKRSLCNQRNWLIRIQRYRLETSYRNLKLPYKFYNNKFYIKLWNNNYNEEHPRRVIYQWKYRKLLVFKSLRYFYNQLEKQQLLYLWKLVDYKISIYNNKYDLYLSKLENLITNQANKFGLSITNFWSTNFSKNGWIQANNPDNMKYFTNSQSNIKKYLFPITIYDPKNLYYYNYHKTYKYQQFSNLFLTRRKNELYVNKGDIIKFITCNHYFISKFQNSYKSQTNLILNKNILFGETLEHKVSKSKLTDLVQRETYNSVVVVFNPRIQDLKILDRTNLETILFSIKCMH